MYTCVLSKTVSEVVHNKPSYQSKLSFSTAISSACSFCMLYWPVLLKCFISESRVVWNILISACSKILISSQPAAFTWLRRPQHNWYNDADGYCSPSSRWIPKTNLHNQNFIYWELNFSISQLNGALSDRSFFFTSFIALQLTLPS